MSSIQVDHAGAVTTITLNRPDKRNALDGEMVHTLVELLEADPRPEQRVLVLRGNGPVFSAGMDLRELQAGTLPRRGDQSPIEPIVHGLQEYPLPVVAVVHGDAIAGGCEMAIHCDFVVASTAARLGVSLVQLGRPLSWSLAMKVLEVAGPVGARDVLMLGDPIPAERLYQLGVISRLAAPEELEVEAQRLIDRLAANAPLALKAMKQLLLRGMRYRDDIPHDDLDAFGRLVRDSEDAKEGTQARLEKRPPNFRGV
jgi:enoyl-CoA hydratase/carnithine racemase